MLDFLYQNWELWLNIIKTFNYSAIIFFMFLESSLFPFPSEIIIIPAGYFSYTHQLNPLLIIISGTLGSVLGALFNYQLAQDFKITSENKNLKFINHSKLKKAEQYFRNHNSIIIFNSRLIPVIRQYISLPAGYSKTNLKSFLIYTILGSSIWITILTYTGYLIRMNLNLLKTYKTQITTYTLIFITLTSLIYILHHTLKRKN